MAAYRIGGERLAGIADEARRLGNLKGKLTPAQIQKTLAAVQPGDNMLHHVITRADTAKTVVTVESLEPASMYYYNGILMPKLPQDALAEHPCCWIRRNDDTGNYELLMSEVPWYPEKKYETTVLIAENAGGSGVKKYIISQSNAGSAVSWEFLELVTNTHRFGYGSASRALVWANHNISGNDHVATYWSMPVAKEG